MVFLTTAFSTNQVGLYNYNFSTTSWKWIASGNNFNVWANNNPSAGPEVPKLSDGVTNRIAGNNVIISDAGNFGLGVSN